MCNHVSYELLALLAVRCLKLKLLNLTPKHSFMLATYFAPLIKIM